MLTPGANHTFTQTALFHEITLKTADLLIDQVIGLVNKADSYIRNDLEGTGLTELDIMFIGYLRIATDSPNKSSLTALLLPNRKVSYSQ